MRGIRGATCLQADDAAEMRDAVAELVVEMLARNDVSHQDLVTVLLTSTPDLTCDFPAAAARKAGIGDTPVLCAQEIDVQGALARVVRILMLADIETPKDRVVHVYLRGAEALRPDLPR